MGSPGTGSADGGSDASNGGAGPEEQGVADDPEEDRFSEDYEKAYYLAEEPGVLGANPTSFSEVQSANTAPITPPSNPRPPVIPPPPPSIG